MGQINVEFYASLGILNQIALELGFKTEPAAGVDYVDHNDNVCCGVSQELNGVFGWGVHGDNWHCDANYLSPLLGHSLLLSFFLSLLIAGSDELNSRREVVKKYFHTFMHENALNPMLFPELIRFETEVVAMTASMLHGDGQVVGNVTSGGTESILMTILTYRDRARELVPQIRNPEVVST